MLQIGAATTAGSAPACMILRRLHTSKVLVVLVQDVLASRAMLQDGHCTCGCLTASTDLRACNLGERTVWSECVNMAFTAYAEFVIDCATAWANSHSVLLLTECIDSIARCMAGPGCSTREKTRKKGRT